MHLKRTIHDNMQHESQSRVCVIHNDVATTWRVLGQAHLTRFQYNPERPEIRKVLIHNYLGRLTTYRRILGATKED